MPITNKFASTRFATRLSEQLQTEKGKPRTRSVEQPKADSLLNKKDDNQIENDIGLSEKDDENKSTYFQQTKSALDVINNAGTNQEKLHAYRRLSPGITGLIGYSDRVQDLNNV